MRDNPVLTSEAVTPRPSIWYESTKRWIMVHLAVGAGDADILFSNLKDWTFESRFGEGQGAHGGVWECPDLFELSVEGTNDRNGCCFVI